VGYYSICSFLGLYINSTAFMGWRAGAAVERTVFEIWELPRFKERGVGGIGFFCWYLVWVGMASFLLIGNDAGG
jgi:hypothetical protein